MTPDDPIDDPVREIAQSTRAMLRNLARLTSTTQDTRDLCIASLRVTRALGWGVLVMLGTLVLVLSVLVLHVLRVL